LASSSASASLLNPLEVGGSEEQRFVVVLIVPISTRLREVFVGVVLALGEQARPAHGRRWLKQKDFLNGFFIKK
jgi:hypothetical protein